MTNDNPNLDTVGKKRSRAYAKAEADLAKIRSQFPDLVDGDTAPDYVPSGMDEFANN